MRISSVVRCALTLMILALTYWVYTLGPAPSGESKGANPRLTTTAISTEAKSTRMLELVAVPAP